ncbi:hypothetical protein [Candidatus Finniella inopinata]|uniref:Uncharacterized protein n=1 Tax=Candidatus Finniella inopinata TaxID=1696036 RepID=A0A4Q7DJB7_9PROT|nr:hypothetical protein [Candidatus Finniella inopinata]RZI47091.1 hypothetical protein EQU50_00450 [Candidatus Finniella inopinata]
MKFICLLIMFSIYFLNNNCCAADSENPDDSLCSVDSKKVSKEVTNSEKETGPDNLEAVSQTRSLRPAHPKRPSAEEISYVQGLYNINIVTYHEFERFKALADLPSAEQRTGNQSGQVAEVHLPVHEPTTLSHPTRSFFCHKIRPCNRLSSWRKIPFSLLPDAGYFGLLTATLVTQNNIMSYTLAGATVPYLIYFCCTTSKRAKWIIDNICCRDSAPVSALPQTR